MTVDEHVEIGTKILLRVLLLALILAFVFAIRDVILLIFLAVLTSAALAPAVNRLKRKGFSRTSAVIVVYGLLFIVLISLISFLVPVFLQEVRDFLTNWPKYFERFNSAFTDLQVYLQHFGLTFDRDAFISNIEQDVSNSVTGIFTKTIGFFGGVVKVLGFLFLALYLSLEEKGIEKFFLLLTPDRYRTYALSVAERMQGKVSQWLFGQVLLMTIVFSIYFIGLTLLDIPYALAVAIFGGVMEIIPYVGPILAAIPAIIFGLLVSPITGVSVLAFYVIAHQIEGHIIAPQVLKHSIGLNPVVLIIAILIGAKLAGPLGMLLSVPTVMILSVFVEDLFKKKGLTM